MTHGVREPLLFAIELGASLFADSAWQPIETAPRDGSYFLAANQWGVWVAHYQTKAVSGYVFDDPWRSVMLNHWHIPKELRYNAATHWAPLPVPPGIGAAQADDSGDTKCQVVSGPNV